MRIGVSRMHAAPEKEWSLFEAFDVRSHGRAERKEEGEEECGKVRKKKRRKEARDGEVRSGLALNGGG